MRFKVPQNIDMQDRIVGPLTMVQFIYAVIGFGGAYAVFSSLPAPFGFLFAAPIAIFVILVDFVKINERPFLNFFISAIQYIGAPKQRVWHQGADSDMSVELYKTAKPQATVIAHKAVSKEDIRRIARQADTGKAALIKN